MATDKGIKPQHFVAIGDSTSDLEKAQEAFDQGHQVEFVFVGDTVNIYGQSRKFPIRISGSQFEKGTLQYLQGKI